jgi:uncharacterized protein (DUF2249 family)
MDSITPDTKLASLLNEFPQLEETLVQLSPAFAKLRNPLLRNTIARVATLRQVAEVGGIPLADLINTLRKTAGLPVIAVTEQGPASRPDWMDASTPVQSFDAREMLASGGHPLNRVLSEIATLHPGERYELITPFTPAPLIEAVRKKGFRVWSETEGDESIRTFITCEE